MSHSQLSKCGYRKPEYKNISLFHIVKERDVNQSRIRYSNTVFYDDQGNSGFVLAHSKFPTEIERGSARKVTNLPISHCSQRLIVSQHCRFDPSNNKPFTTSRIVVPKRAPSRWHGIIMISKPLMPYHLTLPSSNSRDQRESSIQMDLSVLCMGALMLALLHALRRRSHGSTSRIQPCLPRAHTILCPMSGRHP